MMLVNPGQSSSLVPNQGSMLTLDQVEKQLPKSLLYALERGWYDQFQIHQYAVAPHSSGDVELQSRFLQVQEVVYAENMGIGLHLQNMQNVISSLRDSGHALIYALRSDGFTVKLLTGVRSFTAGGEKPGGVQYSTENFSDVLYRALRSNYPGIVLRREESGGGKRLPYALIPYTEYRSDLMDPMRKYRYLAAITGIPSLRAQNQTAIFSQSIDRLVDALRGETYTLMVLAEPIVDQRLAEIIRNLRNLSSEVHKLVRDSRSISKNQSVTKGTSSSESTSMSLGLGQMLTTILGISVGRSVGETISNSETEGLGATWTQEHLDKTAQFCEQVLDHYINRLQSGRSMGFWNVGVYLASQESDTFLRAQAIARSLYSGTQTYFEPLRVVNLSKAQPEVRDALASFRNPALTSLTPRNAGEVLSHPLGAEFHSLGTPLTTEELSILASFPTREVPGMKLKPVADFNLNPPLIGGARLGSLLYRGEELSTEVRVSAKSLTRHTFVTGLTGSGKTNTVLALLKNAFNEQKTPFLIIDPAKWEYRFLLEDPDVGKTMQVFTLGNENLAPFRLNPFSFPRGFALLTHLDLIKAVFNAAFPMYASMPYLLEDALLEIYTERGWNVAKSTNRYVDMDNWQEDYTPYLPRLSDLYDKIDHVVARKKYGKEISENLTAALKARLSSLMVGAKGLMLDTQCSVPFEEILRQPTLLELRAFGDDDEKAMVMSFLFVALYEQCWLRPADGKLHHVLVVEEAHRLLRNVPVTASAESANPRGKAVEMFTDMMAEMRVHGEGFIIVDQMPGKLVPDVIKGSNLKIVHRLMAEDDRRAVGNAMGMTQTQVDFLPRLRVGQAVVHSEELGEACLVQIDSVEDELAGKRMGDTAEAKEKSIEQKLRAKSSQFFADHVDILRKYSACMLCDAPCTYQPEENIPSQELLRITDRLLFAIAIGTGELIAQLSKQMQSEFEVILQRAYPRGASAGQVRCLHIQTATVAGQRFCQSFTRSGSWQALVELQKQLAELFENFPVDHARVMAIRQHILKEIATAPLVPKPGCVLCPRRCWFGHLFQVPNHPMVGQLTAQLKHIPQGKTFNPEKLIQLVGDTYQGQTASVFHPFAAYCLLTQATESEAILADMRRVVGRKV